MEKKQIRKTWDTSKHDFIETPRSLQAFFNEIDMVCMRYGLSISHEDGHGAFMVELYSEKNIEWLKEALKNY